MTIRESKKKYIWHFCLHTTGSKCTCTYYRHIYPSHKNLKNVKIFCISNRRIWTSYNVDFRCQYMYYSESGFLLSESFLRKASVRNYWRNRIKIGASNNIGRFFFKKLSLSLSRNIAPSTGDEFSHQTLLTTPTLDPILIQVNLICDITPRILDMPCNVILQVFFPNYLP